MTSVGLLVPSLGAHHVAPSWGPNNIVLVGLAGRSKLRVFLEVHSTFPHLLWIASSAHWWGFFGFFGGFLFTCSKQDFLLLVWNPHGQLVKEWAVLVVIIWTAALVDLLYSPLLLCWEWIWGRCQPAPKTHPWPASARTWTCEMSAADSARARCVGARQVGSAP